MTPTVKIEMSLQDLFDAASQSKDLQSRLKDVKTAVRVLANALGFPSPDACPPHAYALPIEKIYEMVDRTQAGKGEHTKRNTRNNLSALFRTAAAKGLLLGQKEQEEKTGRTKPPFDIKCRKPRRGSSARSRKNYYLSFAKWPNQLVSQYQELYVWATAPVVEGRPSKHRKRASTMASYQQAFRAFFGYLLHIKKMPLNELQLDLFWNPEHLRDFALWHINTIHKRATSFIHSLLKKACALLRQYRSNPEALEKINRLKGQLDAPDRVYDKDEAWVPLAKLEAVGRAILPTRMPLGKMCNGRLYARAAGMSLIIRLWCRRPYRQRNIREMELGSNLYKNADGKWMIRFEGEELKVGRKNGNINCFELPFPEDLVQDLENYLSVWRPLLINGVANPPKNVFLIAKGTPYESENLKRGVANCVYSYTGKPFHPHLIRTIWTTEYIRETHDFYTAAVMLNDTLETVIENYAHLLDQGTALKADQRIEAIIRRDSKSAISDTDNSTAVKNLLTLLTSDTDLISLLNEHPALLNKLITAINRVQGHKVSSIPEPLSPPLSLM